MAWRGTTMPLALSLIGVILLFGAIAYLVVSSFRFRAARREHDRYVEGLPDEQHGLYIQRERYRTDLEAATGEHQQAVKQAERELKQATSDYGKRVRNAQSRVASAQGFGRKQLDSLRGRNGTVKLFEDRVEAPGAVIPFSGGRVKTKVETRGRLYKDGRDTREVYLHLESPQYKAVLRCDPDDEHKALELAASVTNASADYPEIERNRQAGIVAAETELENARADTAARDTAQRKLESVTADTSKIDDVKGRLEDLGDLSGLPEPPSRGRAMLPGAAGILAGLVCIGIATIAPPAENTSGNLALTRATATPVSRALAFKPSSATHAPTATASQHRVRKVVIAGKRRDESRATPTHIPTPTPTPTATPTPRPKATHTPTPRHKARVSKPAPTSTPAPTATPTNTPTPKPALVTARGQLYPVTKVTDGDTIHIEMHGQDVTLRLIGMDTPETKDPRKPVQCFGRQASRKGHELLAGQRVRISGDPTQSKYDKYGRLLAYVWREDGLFYNEWMIAHGYAHEYTYDVPYRYQSRFQRAQAHAREAELGFWSPSTCNGDTTQAASGSQGQQASTMYVDGAAQNYSGANLRSEPTVDSAQLDTLSNGESVQVVDTVTGSDGSTWYKVSYGNESGYILGSLLSPQKPAVTQSGGNDNGGNNNSGSCDPHYPTICVPPPPPDLDCKDIPHYSNFKVLPPDPHGFDGNDQDGKGCESN